MYHSNHAVLPKTRITEQSHWQSSGNQGPSRPMPFWSLSTMEFSTSLTPPPIRGPRAAAGDGGDTAVVADRRLVDRPSSASSFAARRAVESLSPSPPSSLMMIEKVSIRRRDGGGDQGIKDGRTVGPQEGVHSCKFQIGCDYFIKPFKMALNQ